jgi:hypothetical protein
VQLTESEIPTAPLQVGWPVAETAMPGAAGHQARPVLASPFAGAMLPTPMPPITPSDGTALGEEASASVIVELASLAAAPGLSGGDVCQLRLWSNGGAQGAPGREFQGFE